MVAPILLDPLIAMIAAAIAFGLSVKLSLDARFESPYVVYSFALLGRLAGSGAAFAYPPSGGTLLPILPDGDLGFLLFYPILVGAFRMAARAYGGTKKSRRRLVRGPVLATLPLIGVDALRLLWSLSARRIPFTRGAHFPHILTLPYGVWGALTAVGVGLFVAGVFVSRKESA